MTIANFVPEFWSARLLRHLDSRLIYASPQLSNRDWEGEIQGVGDTVHIQKVDDPTVKERTKYSDLDAPEQPSGDTAALVIDEDWYFNVSIDDVDAWQANVALLDRFAERAARGMREKIDSTAGAVMVAGAGIEIGTAGAPVDVIEDGSGDFTFWELVVEMGVQLDEADVPEEARWVVITPQLAGVATKDDRFIPASALGDQVTRQGLIGEINGFTVYKTNVVPYSASGGGARKVLFSAGNYSHTFATELAKLEAYRPEKRFEDALKGMEVWGSKVVESESLGVAHVTDETAGS